MMLKKRLKLKDFFHWIDSRIGIQGKLTVIFIVFSAVPLFIIGIYAIKSQIDSMKTESLHNIKIDIEQLRNRTASFFSQIESEMNLFSNTTEMNRFLEDLELAGSRSEGGRAGNQEAIEREFLNALNEKPHYFKVALLSKDGREIFALLFKNKVPQLISGEHLSENPLWFYLYVVQGMKSGEVIILPSEIRNLGNKEIIQTISLIKPLFNRRLDLVSILITHISFQEFIQFIRLPSRIDEGKTAIANGEGYYIYNSTARDWNKFLASREERTLFNDYSQEIASLILSGDQGTITNFKGRIIEYASIFTLKVSEAGHYVIFIDIATSVIFSKVRQFQRLFIFFVSMVTILSIAIGYLTAHHYLKPIKHLMVGAINIREGNLDFKFSLESRDEIQTLVEGYNRLVNKARKALKESEGRFHQIFMQSDYAIFIFEPKDHNVIDANPAACSLYGYSRREIIGESISFLFEASCYQKFRKVLGSVRKFGKFQMEQIENLKKDGTRFKVAVRGKILKLRDINVVYCDFQDMTEENRMREEALLIQEKLIHTNKMAYLGTLASGVAHEINNPNNSIMLNIAALSEVWDHFMPIINRYQKENKDFTVRGIDHSELSEKIPKLFSGISGATQRIKNIISDLKGFAWPEPLILKKDIDINEVIRVALSLTENLITKSTRYFSVIYGEEIPKCEANFQKLEQVIINLVQNACEALSDLDKKISILTSYNEETRYIEVKVKDEGYGIPKDKLPLVTDPFFTTKRNIGGTGLGLSIASSIIRDHGGSLTFESEAGAGTLVTIKLPRKNENNEEKNGSLPPSSGYDC